MSGFDRNRIDRLPTRGERLVGIALAGTASLVFLSLMTLGLFVLAKGDPTDRSYGIGFVSVTGVMALGSIFLLYRLAFTEPKALSSRANRRGWAVLASFSTLAFVLCLMWPASRSFAPGLAPITALTIFRMVSARIESSTARKRRA